MSAIRLGIVGAGHMGSLHSRVARQVRSLDLVGVFDPISERAQRLARQHETTAYPTLDAMLADVDAVVIATPTRLHAATASAALARGKHVLIEKPIATELSDAEAIAAAARASGTVATVGHTERYNTAFRELETVLGDQRPLAINIRRLNYYAPRITDMDVTLDLLIHDVDLVLAITGTMPDSVEATGLRAVDDRLDHVDAVFTFPDGTIASLTASRVTEDKIRRIEIVASGRYIVADLLRRTLTVHKRATSAWEVTGSDVKFRLDSVTEQVQVPVVEPLQAELADLAEAIATGRPPLVTIDDGVRALRVVLDVQRTAEARAPARRGAAWPISAD